MSDDILIKLSTQIGQLTGTVNAMAEQQKAHGKNVSAILEKHDSRIDRLEGDRRAMLGIAVGSSLAGSGVWAAVLKLFGGGS